MPPIRTIKAKAIISDVRAGFSDSELMIKYGLSSEELQTVFRRLAQAGAIRWAELDERRTPTQDMSRLSGTRTTPRSYLRIPPTIIELEDQSNKGLLTDISQRGFRTRGIVSQIGVQKTFLILASESSGDIQIVATCKWKQGDSINTTQHESGHIIDHVSDTDMLNIHLLIGSLGLGDRNRRRG
jgi:hypothetical protein